MIKYIYKPDSSYWTNSEVDNFFKETGESLKNFFNLPDIKNYVNTNNWEMVFEKWENGDIVKYNPETFISEVLAFFLYKIGVDFLPYLENPKRFSITCLKLDLENNL